MSDSDNGEVHIFMRPLTAKVRRIFSESVVLPEYCCLLSDWMLNYLELKESRLHLV